MKIEDMVGQHRAKVVEADMGHTSTNRPQVGVAFDILGDDDKVKFSITYYGVFGDESFGDGTMTDWVIKNLRTMGWKGDDLSDLSSIVGWIGNITIENEPYNGKDQPRVKWINRAGGIAMKSRMTDAEKRAFAQKMRGQVIASGKKTGADAPSRGPSESGPPPRKDDDVPF